MREWFASLRDSLCEGSTGSLSPIRIWRNGKRWLRVLRGLEPNLRPSVRVPVTELGSGSCAWAFAPSLLPPSPLVYSFGVGTDLSFERELIGRFHATVHAFDPTPPAIRWIRDRELPSALVFHPWGIAGRDGEAEFHAPTRADLGSFSGRPGDEYAEQAVRLPVRRIETTMRDLGHRSVDLLKMDVEGMEYDVVEDIVSLRTPVGQLLVEFHHRRPEIGPDATRQAVHRLRGAGYRIFHVSPTGREYALAHVSVLDEGSPARPASDSTGRRA